MFHDKRYGSMDMLLELLLELPLELLLVLLLLLLLHAFHHVHTRCTFLGATQKALARKLWGGSRRSCRPAWAAKRKTNAKPARFF